jgi:tripartite-type tricarboxylate transporter receptor subunit TctC
MADRLAKSFGQPFIIENKGGGGIIGTEFAPARPMTATALLRRRRTIHPEPADQELSYDPITYLTPISMVIINGMALVRSSRPNGSFGARIR